MNTMRELKLITFSTNDVTMGKLYEGKDLICYTIERPWLKNARNVSCIPAGEYDVEMVNSPKFGHTYEVKDVPGRTHILFHKGNYVRDSFGCILPVSGVGIISLGIGGLLSAQAFTKLMNTLKGDSFKLTIQRL